MIDIIYFFFRSPCTFADTMAKPFLLYFATIVVTAKVSKILEFLSLNLSNSKKKFLGDHWNAKEILEDPKRS